MMEEYTELIRNMADVYLSAVRDLETENARLKSENEYLKQELSVLRGRSDEWWDGGEKKC